MNHAACCDAISPKSGTEVGGTLVNVSGGGFADGSHYVCAFGSELVDASYVAAYGVISCVSPAGVFGSQPVVAHR